MAQASSAGTLNNTGNTTVGHGGQAPVSPSSTPLVAVALIAGLALIARPGVLPLALAGVLVVQTVLLQSLQAGLTGNPPVDGGLHALDGLLVLAIAGLMYASARRRRS